MKLDKNNSSWEAWYDMQPGIDPTKLHVIGKVDVGNNTTGVSLQFAAIEKSFPPNLILKVVEHTIFIPRKPNDNIVPVHYSENGSTANAYGKVKIVLEDGTSIAEIEDIKVVH